MKYLVVSDIHGSSYYAKKLEEIIEKEKPEKIIILGDIYYHGPRNPLPKEYNPMEVANILNKLKEKILCIRGNCDAEVDEMISEFPFSNQIELTIQNVCFCFMHGHKLSENNLPKNTDVIVYGHFHTGFIKEKNGILLVNSGSISLPKEETAHSYITIDENEIILKDVDGTVINSYPYSKLKNK